MEHEYYADLEMEIITFSSEDVITSSPQATCATELPIQRK